MTDRRSANRAPSSETRDGGEEEIDAVAGSGPAPAELGYRMPGEWEEHRATWIAWPHHPGDWEGKSASIPWTYVEIVRCLAEAEEVCVLVQDGNEEANARRVLERGAVDTARVEFYTVATDRSWIRDYGPLFVTAPGGAVAAVNWRFNGWSRFPDWQLDDRVAAQIARLRDMRRFDAVVERQGLSRHIVLEGGSIDVNGAGLALATEECLLADVQTRNVGFTRADVERCLERFVGVDKVLWLAGGIAGDDTHGHIDDVARFVAPRTVVAGHEENVDDENHAVLAENLRRLEEATGVAGDRLEIVTLPMPRPIHFDGHRLPASYLNFYVGNGRVLVPTFNDPADRVALGKLAELFPDREVVGIHAVDLVVGCGAIHCSTQQEPRGG